MKRFKKITSAALSVTISLLLVLSMLVSSGITVSFAASSTAYKGELWLMNGVDNALLRGTRVEISGGAAPYDVNGKTVYIPLSVLCDYTGASYTIAGETVTVNRPNGGSAYLTVGEYSWSDGNGSYELLLPVVREDGEIFVSALTARSLLSVNTFYNPDLGLLVVSTSRVDYTRSRGKALSSGGNGYIAQAEVLGNLLFDRPSGDTVLADIEQNVGLETHPRLLADADKFDELRRIYYGTDDNELYQYVRYHVLEGYSVFTSYFADKDGEVVWSSEQKRLTLRQPYYLYDEHGNRLVGQTTYSYVDENGEVKTLKVDGSGRGDGYDLGGRSDVATYTKKLKQLAFVWQITGEDKYADAFYLLATELGKWEHWGEGHFLNCADGSVEFAIGLDWIWHAFDSEPEKRDELAGILYEKGMMKGYYSIVCDSLYSGSEPKLSESAASSYLSISYTAGSTAWRTINRENNWQTVCGSGMIVSALLLSDYEQYRTKAAFVIEEYLESLERCLGQYVPDGSYIESPGYWGYGTNTLMVTLASLESSAGDDYGYLDIVGLHDSFYYICGVSNSSYNQWNYHDSGEGRIDGTSFYYAAAAYGDTSLAAVRNDMIFNRGVNMTLMDVLYYDPSLSDAVGDIPLDYNFIGIDTATFRSSWDSDAVFTGLHTGPNHVTHGDYDCGNFTLSMGGVQWIADPGAENYNVSGFWSTGVYGKRYHLYAKSIEGHSTVMITSNPTIPLGQTYTTYSTDYATIDSYYSDEYGGYAVTDMTAEYGYTCTSGRRGVLLTNSRSTVVLQDEITFSSATSLVWMLNLQNFLFMSEDGRTIDAVAYINNERVVMRVSLISEDESLKFRLMKNYLNTGDGTYETVFDGTYTKTNNSDPLAKDPVQRVVIEAENVTDFNVAVVFQILGHEDEIVPYEYTPMAEWSTTSDEWVKEANKDIVYDPVKETPRYQLSHFVKANARLEAATSDMEIGEILRDTAVILTDYDYTNTRVAEAAEEYMSYFNDYLAKLQGANKVFRDILFGEGL